MTLARTHSVALVGVEGHVVECEADIANGLVGMILVGLPDTALREARDRIRSAIINSGEQWPQRRITVGLSPASLPKRGSGFDLPIACALLAAAGVLQAAMLAGTVFLGELGLDGQLRPVRGVLPATMTAAAAGFRCVVVARANAPEAALVPGLRVVSAPTLAALLAWLRGEPPAGGAAVEELTGGSAPAAPPAAPQVPGADDALPTPDLSDVLGQPVARRAAEICAAGGHHLSLLGPPGAGKTMLAERLPTILPRLDPEAALEVTAIHSVAGTLPRDCPLLTSPPFCGPHHTASKAAIVGGGSGIIHPGAASLAHQGVLFLDEAPEFGRDVLDALRQPLESGEVVIARSGATARFPARFTLVLAANPCPCARACCLTPVEMLLQPGDQAAVSGPPVRAAAGPGGRQGRAASGRPGRAAQRPEVRREQRHRGRPGRRGSGAGGPPLPRYPVAGQRGGARLGAATLVRTGPQRHGTAGAGYGDRRGQRARHRQDRPGLLDSERPGRQGPADHRRVRLRPRSLARGSQMISHR